MKETIKLALILFIIASVCTGILAVGNSFTSVIIEERQAKELQEALKVVSPDATEFTPIEADKLTSLQETLPSVKNMYEAKADGNVIGYVFDLIGKGGYGGDISFILGIKSEDKSISGIKILGHGETPGFGAAIEEPAYAEGVVGATDADGVKAITGATKTSNAMKNAIKQAFDAIGQVSANNTTNYVVSR
ncbi:MAG: FMN-binding protein [Tissierellia bacterium]|nr:FMN-binding protein [Tissierellia bacterium]